MRGCPNLTDNRAGLCENHLLARSQQVDERRPSSSKRGYSAKWRAASAKFLAEHPYCADGCGGRSAVVDHIKPHRGDQKLFWDQGNWAAMTKRCHDRKTATEDGGFGNAKAGVAGAGASGGRGVAIARAKRLQDRAGS